ncbi:MAG: hypothetical protein Q9193_002428 [Seirophora villosa]
MRHTVFSIILLPSILALEPVSPSSTSPKDSPRPVVLMLETPAPQPPRPYLELRHLDLDRRQIQPAAAGAPAQAAAGAPNQPVAPAPVAPVAAPKAAPNAAPVAAPAAPVPAVPAPAGAAAPAAPAAPVGGVVPVKQGPATAVTSAPTPKSGTIGMGTLTGAIGVVKTSEAKSEAGLAVDNRFGFMTSWPAAFKVGASVLLGTAVGVGILL